MLVKSIRTITQRSLVGIRYNLKYHTNNASVLVYRVSNETITTDDFLRGVKEVQKEMFSEWETSPEKAKLSSNAIDAGFKIRPTEEELKEMGPEFNELWNRYFKDKPDKPVMFGSIVAGAYADHTLLPPGNYVTMFQYLEYPASRGKVSIHLMCMRHTRSMGFTCFPCRFTSSPPILMWNHSSTLVS